MSHPVVMPFETILNEFKTSILRHMAHDGEPLEIERVTLSDDKDVWGLHEAYQKAQGIITWLGCVTVTFSGGSDHEVRYMVMLRIHKKRQLDEIKVIENSCLIVDEKVIYCS
jgi:hypothetical protein